LVRNGITGLVLVFFLLALFLEIRVAFWVSFGIPVSIFGACAVMYAAGDTLNMISMFGILMALGMVVDDAIVVSENIFRLRQRGQEPKSAAVDGCLEVAPSVANSVMTTVVAFLPLFFVSGVLGKFIAIMPLAVVAMLSVSLCEAVIGLPGHLAHARTGPIDWTLRVRQWFFVRFFGPLERAAGPALSAILRAPLVLLLLALLLLLTPIERAARALEWLRVHFDAWLQTGIDRVYTPLIGWTLRHTAIGLAGCVATLLLALGLVKGGVTPYIIFPKLDDEVIRAVIMYPDGTPGSVTDEATQRLEQAAQRTAEEFAATGRPIVETTYRSVGEVTSDDPGGGGERGSHVGSVMLELVAADRRGVLSRDIIARWRELAGEFPGAEELSFAGMVFGPGGKPIEFRLIGKDFVEIEAAAEKIKTRLKSYPGVFDVHDDYNPGKWEWRLKIKPLAESMGVQLADLSDTVRASYYGAEVMRLQRGRHEVKLMVRYPKEERRSLANFEEIRVRWPNGAEVPLTEVAEVQVARGASEIHRVNQFRSITVTADIDETTANAHEIVGALQADYVPAVLREHPGVSILWEGQQQETQESVQSLMRGFIVAAFGIFVLLTLEFRTYGQPLIVMAVIPFGLVGAVLGHLVLGLPITMFSLFGIVALSGIVVNDAIVLIDLVNRLREDGMPLQQALVQAGRRRFRPILLTSVTTIGGLTPLLLETSFQAQVLIPMAASISFGLLLSTIWVLLLVPTIYQIHARWQSAIARVERPATEALEPDALTG
jgi:multidrug efflux pump subunit AcrB